MVILEIAWVSSLLNLLFWTFIVGAIVFGLYADNRIRNAEDKIAQAKRNEEFQINYNSPGLFTYSESGFNFKLKDAEVDINWNDIEAIFAYKRDLITIDQICMDIMYSESKSLTISEDTLGWYIFVSTIEKKFNINSEWSGKISYPAFKTMLTLLYDKEGITQEEAEKKYYKN